MKALIECLGAEERAILSYIDIPISLKHFLGHKIQEDIRISYGCFHSEIIRDKFHHLNRTSNPTRNNEAYFLTEIIEFADYRLKRLVGIYLLNSKYKGVRERGLKFILKNWDEYYIPYVIRVWDSYNHKGCLKVFLYHFSTSYLFENYKVFYNSLTRFELYQLYNRLSEIDQTIPIELNSKNPISYAYFLVKTQQQLTEEQV